MTAVGICARVLARTLALDGGCVSAAMSIANELSGSPRSLTRYYPGVSIAELVEAGDMICEVLVTRNVSSELREALDSALAADLVTKDN